MKLEITELKSSLASLKAHNLSLQSTNNSDKEEMDNMKREYTDNESKSQILLKNHISQLENEIKSIRVEMSGYKNLVQSGQSEYDLLQSKYDDILKTNKLMIDEKNESETESDIKLTEHKTIVAELEN